MIEVISLLVSTVPYLLALLLGLALPVLCVLTYMRFGAGLALIAITHAIDLLTQSAPILNIGLTLYVADLPMLLIAVIAGLRWLFRADIPKRHAGWTIFTLVFFVGLAIGLVRNGTAAGVTSRPDFYAIATASYAMSFPISRIQIRQMVVALLSLSTFLLLLTIFRWTVYYGHITALLPSSGTYNTDGAIRVVSSSAALIIAQALMIGMFFGQLGGGAIMVLRNMVPLFAGAVLVLQHRSVWLASMAGACVSFVLAGAQQVSRTKQILMLLALVLVATVALTFGGKVTEGIESSAARAAQGSDTVSARFENWRVTLSDWQAAGPRAILIGREPGSVTGLLIINSAGERVRITAGAHNIYVTLLSGTGVIGLSAFLWAIGSTLLRLYRACRIGGDNAVDAALMLVLMMMQLVYYIAYMSDFMQFMIFGISLALAYRITDPVNSGCTNENAAAASKTIFERNRAGFRP